MKEIISEDKDVVKLIHDDGTESIWKFGQSCSGPKPQKATLFVSSSYGCIMKCAFCWLTNEKIEYKKITQSRLIQNIKEAIDWLDEWGFEHSFFDFKLSFMGMGDVRFETEKDYEEISQIILDYAKYKGFRNILGVDFCFSGPVGKKQIQEINNLDFTLKKKKKGKVRLFFSIHSVINKTRHSLGLGNIENISKTIGSPELEYIEKIFHVTLLDRVNDSPEEVVDLCKFANLYNAELRILNYNKHHFCDLNSSHENVASSVKKLLSLYCKKFKIQISIGSEINSACGQIGNLTPMRIKNCKSECSESGYDSYKGILNDAYTDISCLKNVECILYYDSFGDMFYTSLEVAQSYNIKESELLKLKGIFRDGEYFLNIQKDAVISQHKINKKKEKLAAIITKMKESGLTDEDIKFIRENR